MCSDTEDSYTFSDGTALTYSGDFGSGVTWTAGQFTSWKDNQPASSDDTRANQDCVKIDKNGKWDEVGCASTRNYACQIPVGTIPAGQSNNQSNCFPNT